MLVDRFDCEEVFNDFFKEQAKTWMAEGGTVTYVMVDKKELYSGYAHCIYGDASIITTGFLGKDRDKNK